MIRTLFLFLGMFYSVMAWRGETYFCYAVKQLKESREVESFVNLVKADAIYPFKHYVREANAALYGVADALPPAVILAVVDNALKHDPNSANLLWYKIYQELKRGNLEAALPALLTMERVDKGFEQTKTARRLFEAVRDKLKALQRKDG